MIKNKSQMTNKLHVLDFTKRLVALGERQGEVANQAGSLIISVFRDADIPFRIERFITEIPVVSRAELSADGRKIECLSTSFTGGKIANKDSIASSLISSQPLISKSNINFNPKCQLISRSNFYFAPALAIKAKDVGKVVNAKLVKGISIVARTKVESRQILVGNSTNPKSLIFCHYDSIGPGAVDNASGVAVLLETIIRNREVLKNSLFIFDGNEELSYDFPVYWGHGYRVFEEGYNKLLLKAEKIISVDSVGNGKPSVISDPKIIKLAFPIKNLDKFLAKTVTIAGDIDELMRVYHSDDDKVGELKEEFLNQTVGTLKNLLNS